MENRRNISYNQIIKRDWRNVLVITLIIVLLSLVYTLIQPFKYGATTSILVLQKSSFSIDAYSASKSEERVANKLAQVLYSSSFLDKVLAANVNIDRNYFPTDEQKKRDEWQKTIQADVPVGLSRLDITVYHPEPEQALYISRAITDVLIRDKRDYVGIEDIDLNILDTPLVSKYPVKPNVVVNVLFSLMFGIILGFVFVVVRYNPEKDKLFSMQKEPHLIEYKNIPEDESVEEDIEEFVEDEGSIPEIDDIEDEIEEYLDVPNVTDEFQAEDKLVKEINQSKPIESDLKTPDVSKQIKEDKANKFKDLPEFKDEDEIVKMK